MKPWILIVLFGVLTACTGATGTGGAAPSGGTEAPVTVEIPALDTTVELAYMTGPVVGADSSPSMGKSVRANTSKSASTGRDIMTEEMGSGVSVAYCESRNDFLGLTKASSDSDLMQCISQKDLAPRAQEKSIDIYDGAYHDFRAEVAGEGTLDFRMKFVKNASGGIDNFELFVCEQGKETRYLRQDRTANGVRIYGHGNSLDGGRDIVTVVGSLNSDFQYLAKEVKAAYTGIAGGGPYREMGTLVQGATTATLDAFHTTERKEGAETSRIYSAFELGYSGSLDNLPDPTKYFIEEGAGHFIFETFDTEESWNDKHIKDPTPGGVFYDAIAGTEPRQSEEFTVPTFSGSEVIDCASIKPEVTYALDLSNHVCARFLMTHKHINCITATQGDFVVTASVNGKTLSADAKAPTFIRATSSIVLTSNYAAEPDSFYAGSILIQPYTESTEPDWQNKVDNGTMSWNSTTTQYTLSPKLQGGTTYILRVFGVDGSAKNSNAVHSVGVGGNKMKESAVYYFTVP